jgi:exopolyphosphatase/guanosine-5'-triphosphate,3'-diphosphate pyrophosphatase
VVVAEVVADGVRILHDESAFLGLGAALHDGAPLGRDGRARLTETLAGYAAIAAQTGASTVTFLGTEPLRLAPDAARIVGEVQAATGAPLHVLSHEEEAWLNLIGVTLGRRVDEELLVVDIGGGSSEFAFVGPDRPAAAHGLRLGSARLTARHVSHDPPTVDELRDMREDAGRILESAARIRPAAIVGVGGTASNLLKLVPDAARDATVTPDRLRAARDVLLRVPAAELTERFLVNPVRARLLGAGTAIVEAILDRYGLDELRVSRGSLREGAILAVEHAGPCWRDRLPALVHGWRT